MWIRVVLTMKGLRSVLDTIYLSKSTTHSLMALADRERVPPSLYGDFLTPGGLSAWIRERGVNRIAR